MPRAADHPTSSRRGLLAGFALLPLPGLAALPAIGADPDRDLLELAGEFLRCDAALVRLDGAGIVTDEKFGAIHARWWEIVHAVNDMTAHTQAGYAAKASMLPAIMRDYDLANAPGCRFALSLVEDMVGEG